jgi:2,3-bisphosphoglycerate-dependent phosphoglycerate mutase
MHLYFVRHGQSYVNLPDWEKGNTDEPLTELGHKQAAALAAFLPTRLPQVDMIYASTMQRARETAEALARAYAIAICFDDRIREIGNNQLDHTAFTRESLPNQYVDYWASARPFAPSMVGADNVESWMHFRTRVGSFIEGLVATHRGQTVLVVCHGGVIEAAFQHIFNVGPWQRCEIWSSNTAVTHFQLVEHPDRETWRLHSHNRTDHLAAEAVS